ncbi:sigma-70 family RNA polymerase sigma factor [Magnetospirillum sp. UT-4]|uniref:sigma-70 family RNA polymerase sigma factor n=1 Tax=Magnetospirillum sp. UT-4 TaxID=2681467 RepID=UPI0013844B15|nr:sigma-70 family RNA polymerase sigma factor [Magnetospirillum sp. UT-4]CAA7626197.1 putative RNA polymerase sigma factor [Magnetospirillum sp. UT-4]
MPPRDDDSGQWSRWMAAAQDGDGAAYGRVMAALLPVVRRMVARRLPGSGEREDVVQEVLLTVHTVRHTYDPARPLLPWLAAIVAHRCADLRRGEARQVRRTSSIDDLPETIGAVEPNMMAMDVATLGRAMAALPERQRRALELVKLREMSVADAAAATGMTPGALKVTVHRAIKALKGMLTG